MKLINKAAVVAEIEARYNESLKRAKIIDAEYWNAKADAYRNVLVIVDDTLEVKEVDLEEEINRFWDSCAKHKNERGGNVIWSNKLEVEVLARHFFELGLSAQKGE